MDLHEAKYTFAKCNYHKNQMLREREREIFKNDDTKCLTSE